MKREVVRATAWALAITLVLAAAVVVGSRDLDHVDAALVGYLFATLFAVFGITYRYAMWLQRPPTALLAARLAGRNDTLPPQQCLHGGKFRSYTGCFRNSSALYVQNWDTAGNVWMTTFQSSPSFRSTLRT